MGKGERKKKRQDSDSQRHAVVDKDTRWGWVVGCNEPSPLPRLLVHYIKIYLWSSVHGFFWIAMVCAEEEY